jgi:hypothetical protein
MADETQIQADIEKALRGGNPDDAARVIMTHRNCSLADARKEVAQILQKRGKS